MPNLTWTPYHVVATRLSVLASRLSFETSPQSTDTMISLKQLTLEQRGEEAISHLVWHQQGGLQSFESARHAVRAIVILLHSAYHAPELIPDCLVARTVVFICHREW